MRVSVRPKDDISSIIISREGSLAAKTSLLPTQPLTSHPSVKSELQDNFDYKEESVVVSGKLVTRCVLRFVFALMLYLKLMPFKLSRCPSSVLVLIASRGPGTAFPFAFKLVELLCGEAKVKEVQDPMIFPVSE